MESSKKGESHQLEVKKSALLRTMNEFELYKREFQENSSKLEAAKMKGDDHEIRRAKMSMGESSAVLEDTKRRLAKLATDLDLFLTENVLPSLNSGDVSPVSENLVDESRKLLEDLSSKHPEVRFNYSTKNL